MKTIFFLFVIFWYGSTQSQELSIATKDSIHSNILDEDRSLWISLPQGYDEKSEYPVLYLLDGTENIYATYAVIQELSYDLIPAIIIVAINNTKRARDMSPWNDEPKDPRHKGLYKVTQIGGGKKFVSFLEDELIPYIDKKYSTADYRIIAGHSASGLLALYTAIVHYETYQACIAADPSVWYGNGQITNELTEEVQFSRNKIYLGMANWSDLTLAEIKKDTSSGSFFPQANLKLVDKLKSSNYTGLDFDSKYYKEESHFSVPLITTYDGLKFIFEKYPNQLREREKVFDNDDAIVEIDAMKKRYEDLSEEFGFKVLKKESEVDEICKLLQKREQMGAAKKCFEWNISNYPHSQNVYDNLGDYYLETGNKEQAIELFKKALKIEEKTWTREKLEKLLKED